MRRYGIALLTSLLAAGAVGCGGDDTTDPPNGGEATRFTVTVENISGDSALPTPFSPGVYALQDRPSLLFRADEPDPAEGLEALAEDGDPGELATSIGDAGGAFTQPVEGGGPGPITVGDRYEITFEATLEESPRLTMATMLVQSNDWFVAPDEDGIELFTPDGDPAQGDVSASLRIWNAGTEADEVPGLGPNQAPRQTEPNAGRTEGVVGPFVHATRSLPRAARIVDVAVEEAAGTYTIALANAGVDSGAITTPIAPVFWALHDGSAMLFNPGTPTVLGGLEQLAEDGSPMGLVFDLTGAEGVGEVGAQSETIERPGEMGPAMPGETFELQVTPTSDYPRLSIAAMVVESNDAFVAFGPEGVRLLDENGAPRSADAVRADIRARLRVWDAGTEVNQVPGVGPDQALRQAGPNTGAADPNDAVRLYDANANDLAGPAAGGFADVSVVTSSVGDGFVITLTNDSGGAFPGVLTPVVFAVHDETAQPFASGEPASAALERLAEDGTPDDLADELSGAPGVAGAGVMATPQGAQMAGPLMPGDAYRFTVTPDAESPYVSMWSMIVPSNDTFLAVAPGGVAFFDEAGDPRSPPDIEEDLRMALGAWDAGTEDNEPGAAGPDQAPRQPGPDTGEGEPGTVRLVDPAQEIPGAERLLRVIISAES